MEPGMVELDRVEAASRPVSAHALQLLYLDDVFRYVSAFVRPPAEAEDVTMNVFHAAFSSMKSLRRANDPRLWLLGVARRKVADSPPRHYRPREAELEPTLTSTEPDIDQVLLVGQVLRLLPPDQAQSLVLKYVNGLSVEEIAQLMKRSNAAANSLLQRARDSFYSHGAPHFLHQEDQP